MHAPRPVRTVFSLWAWVALTPYLLTAFGGFDSADTPRDWAIGISVAIVAQLVLGLAFLLLGGIDRRLAPRRWLRWSFVAIAILGLAIGRPALIRFLQGLFGLDLIPTPFPLRVLMNLVAFAVALLLLHLLTESLGRNLEVRRRLLAVLDSLQTQAEQIEEEQERVAASFQREIARPVVDAIGGLLSRDLPPDQLAEELEWVAELVVRPISHRAHAAELDEALAELEPAPAPPNPGRAISPPSQVVAAPAWIVTLVAMLLLLPPELNANGLRIGLLLIAAGSAASFLGGIVIQRLPLPRRPGAAIGVLVLCYLALAAVSCWVLLGPAQLDPLAGYYLAYGTLSFATVAVLLSVLLSAIRELAAHQQLIAASVTHAERRVYQARQTLAASGEQAGRLLHTTVQGDIIGTALRLKAGTAGPEALDRLLERVERTLTIEGMREVDGETPAIAIREALGAVLATWSRSLRLDLAVSEAAFDWLGEHPSAAALTNDAITEGLTNAVRHSQATHVRVSADLAETGSGIEIRVANPGRLGPRAANGLGLRDLDARARGVELTQEGDEVVLRVFV